ncbi:DEAD (Asp-Glu-Ala-Asp) box polypeptide 20 [Modicella reniformis]|uniref:RNA helicase n=1 Tax=Modicella reniformis TaxID=1440133 RepID=A0A9P6J6X1_9FUNG|nr:DEAD (Asp-Glu-Ala-Asp) box polypeptide 20 [Modicella reniformis]
MTLDRFRSKDVQINEDIDFSSLVSNAALLKSLTSAGYTRPSPIQLKTIPLGRLGLDLIAQAKSGTGKTIVFSVIAIETVLASASTNSIAARSEDNGQLPKVIIIAPTREIAVQTQGVILNLTRGELEQQGSCYSMIGGTPIQQDKENLKRCSIVVGTPGRLRSLIATGDLKTSQVRLLVLDEADKLMEDWFRDVVFEISKGLGTKKQVMAFSATYDDDLLAHLDTLVKNPVYVMLSNGTPELEGVMQFFKVATLDEKHKGGSVFLKQIHIMERKFSELENLLTHVPFYQAILFLNHRGRAADLVKFLTSKGWPAMHIASGISQNERLDVMQKARKFELRVLVCSDLIARGIDIDRVNLVVNLDLPKDPETYLHRIGRTGRYGTAGLALSIVDDTEMATIQILRKDFGITIQELSAEDKVYKELKQKTKYHHHERPLQLSADLEQFKKLEAKRVAGEERSREDTQTATSIDEKPKDRRRGGPITNKAVLKPPEGRSTGSKKRRLHIQDKHALLTPETTPSMADPEAESALGQQLGHGKEEDTRVRSHGDLQEVEGDEHHSSRYQNPTHAYHQSVCYEHSNPYIPAVPPFAHFPFFAGHPHYSAYHPTNGSSAHHSMLIPRPAPIFIPPDLPLFPFGPPPQS